MSQPKPNETVAPSQGEQRREIASRISPVLMSIAYPLFKYLVLPGFFQQIQVTGQENLPREGAVILAPTHRSRWDPLLVAYAAGRLVTGRDLRFMVSIDEMKGVQGWFIERLGGFPVNTRKLNIGSLRHGIELLEQKRMLVIFPEGRIVEPSNEVKSIRSGLAYIGLQAEETQPGLNPQMVPISIRYDPPIPSWRSRAYVQIGSPLSAKDYCQEPMKDCAQQLRDDLETALQTLHGKNHLALR